MTSWLDIWDLAVSAAILTATITSIYRDIVEAREYIMIRQLLREVHERVARLQEERRNQQASRGSDTQPQQSASNEGCSSGDAETENLLNTSTEW